ncbi:MAG: cbb3-type cytochrome oxidase assembly protein CcoS [Pseudomonadota bacterium]
MEVLILLIPISLILVLAAMWFFVWSVRDGQYVDLDTEATRILTPEDDDHPDQGTPS